MKRGIALLLSLCVAFSSSTASADAYDAAMARAAAAKEKALDSNDAASWEEALLRFRDADAIRPTKESKYEVATAAAWLKQDDVAAEAYGEALALGLGDPAKTKAEAFILDRREKLAKLVVTGPVGARVIIDGRLRGALPHAAFVVFAGSLRVRVESGSNSKEDTVTTTPGGAEATFDATPAKPPPPVEVPKPVVQPAPPVHEAREERGNRTLGWSLVVTGGAVAVVGLATTIVAISRVNTYQSRVDALCLEDEGGYCRSVAKSNESRVGEAQDASDGVATWRGIRTAGIVTTIVGAVSAVAGGVIVLGSNKERSAATRATFAALPGGGFLSLSGSF